MYFSNLTFVLALFVSTLQPSLLRTVGFGCQQQVRYLNVHEYVSLGLMKEVSDKILFGEGLMMGHWLTHPFLLSQHGITTPRFKMVGSCSICTV